MPTPSYWAKTNDFATRARRIPVGDLDRSRAVFRPNSTRAANLPFASTDASLAVAVHVSQRKRKSCEQTASFRSISFCAQRVCER